MKQEISKKNINEKEKTIMTSIFTRTSTLTKEDFAAEITALAANEHTFNIESVDSGSVFFSLFGCRVDFDFDLGDGEIVIYKPYTDMEIRLSFEIIDEIIKEEDGSYYISFDCGLSDVTIEPTK